MRLESSRTGWTENSVSHCEPSQGGQNRHEADGKKEAARRDSAHPHAADAKNQISNFRVKPSVELPETSPAADVGWFTATGLSCAVL